MRHNRAEKVSGGSRDGHTELATIIEFLRPEDELVVTRLDRLGRDTRDVLNIIHECDQRQAFVTVIDPHVSTRGEAGLYCSDRTGNGRPDGAAVHKRTPARGQGTSQSRGAYQGGKRRIDYEEIYRLSTEGCGPAAIARALGCSRMQLCP